VLGRLGTAGTRRTTQHDVLPMAWTEQHQTERPALYGLSNMDSSGLLIRGFGVRVPGGAPLLTWAFPHVEEALKIVLGPREIEGRSSVAVTHQLAALAVRGMAAAVRSAASRASRGETLV
jgi:hypothetical protein